MGISFIVLITEFGQQIINMKQAFCLVVFIAMAVNYANTSPVPEAQEPVLPQVPPKVVPRVIGPVDPVSFQWELADGESAIYSGHGEKKEGGITSGSYFVVQPDGRTRRVDYTVGEDTGFVANV